MRWDPAARRAFGWLCYLASAAPFVAFVAEAVLSGVGHEDTHQLAVNVLIFAAGGFTAIFVKNAAFNAAMAFNALPHAQFLFHQYGSGRATWTRNDVEGRVVSVSLYRLVGMASTGAWLLYEAPSLWRRIRKGPLA